jgi:P4 family phage/plasmid primase-like protien
MTAQASDVVDANANGTAAGARPRTDLGNAERLVDQHGRDLRYAAGLGWLTWSGRRWRHDTDGEVVRRCKLTVRSIYSEAAQAPSDDLAGQLGKWAKASESSTRIASAIELAKTERPVVVAADRLDADAWKLNVRNGTVDLRTGILHEHRREDLISKLAGAAYRPDATAPRFTAFLERVLPDPDVRAYVQRLAGCAAVGEVSEHVLPFLHGAGANGKTTLLDALRSLFGEYAIQLPSELLVAKRELSAGDQSAIAQLAGVRLATTIEVADGRRMAEVLVKELTGERRLRAKLMRRDHFEFDATHTILLAANHRPAVRGTDHAIWRRIHLIPFEVTIPADEQDTQLAGKLEAERDGILAWVVQDAWNGNEPASERPQQCKPQPRRTGHPKTPSPNGSTPDASSRPTHGQQRKTSAQATTSSATTKACARSTPKRSRTPYRLAAASANRDARAATTPRAEDGSASASGAPTRRHPTPNRNRWNGWNSTTRMTPLTRIPRPLIPTLLFQPFHQPTPNPRIPRNHGRLQPTQHWNT